jgi:ABC transporter substrate binding protein
LNPTDTRIFSPLAVAGLSVTIGRYWARTGERGHGFCSKGDRGLGGKEPVASDIPKSDFLEYGGLISYGVNVLDLDRLAATYADKILKGRKPADLPVEQSTQFELVINLKTAKEIGLLRFRSPCSTGQTMVIK